MAGPDSGDPGGGASARAVCGGHSPRSRPSTTSGSDRPNTAEFSQNIHDAFSTILNFTPRFIAGSLLAYIVSQSFDVWAFHQIRKITGERWLWLRNNLSTMCSQVLDTLIFSLIAWWGTVDLVTALKLGAAKYVFKLAIAMIDTTFIYWARSMFRKHHVPVVQAG